MPFLAVGSDGIFFALDASLLLLQSKPACKLHIDAKGERFAHAFVILCLPIYRRTRIIEKLRMRCTARDSRSASDGELHRPDTDCSTRIL